MPSLSIVLGADSRVRLQGSSEGLPPPFIPSAKGHFDFHRPGVRLRPVGIADAVPHILPEQKHPLAAVGAAPPLAGEDLPPEPGGSFAKQPAPGRIRPRPAAPDSGPPPWCPARPPGGARRPGQTPPPPAPSYRLRSAGSIPPLHLKFHRFHLSRKHLFVFMIRLYHTSFPLSRPISNFCSNLFFHAVRAPSPARPVQTRQCGYPSNVTLLS